MTISQVQQHLRAHSNKAAADACRKFVPGDDKVYGVRMPVLNELVKGIKSGGFTLVDQLWKAGAHEERILAMKLLGLVAKSDPEKALKLVEKYSTQITNWAVCDTMGMQAVAPIRKKYADEIFALAEKLNTSADYWQRRLSLVLVEWYTRDTDKHKDIRKLVNQLKNDKEYYVKKAIVWVEKNFAKEK